MKSLVSFLLLGQLAAAFGADFDIRQPAEFSKIVSPSAKLRKLATGIQFGEGTVWVPRDGGYLVFSDIPGNEIKKWTEKDGLTTYRKPSRNANGNTLDRQGRLLTCEHTGRCVSIEELDGTVRPLVTEYNGKKLNSPNDIVVKSDGGVWFTDPPYGISRAQKEQAGNYVFHFDPKNNSLKTVVTDSDMPNGLCFSPDESLLYVYDSGAPSNIRVFKVSANNELSSPRVLCAVHPGVPDGIRCDMDGRIWCAAGDGVQIFLPDGKMAGKILVPETPANLCFGGKDGRTLFIAARTSLY